ncbi:MAG: hypothetical protein HYV96_14230 [Opitutae bacterium]|nr:hypothetical protein [Opitutae bacterium]
MPHRLKFIDDLLLVEVSGRFDRSALDALAETIVECEADLCRSPDRLTDLSAVVHVTVKADDLRSVLERRFSAYPPFNAFRHALVGATPLQYGMSRMYQILNTSPQTEMEVFTNREDALGWLRPDRAPRLRRELSLLE